jgi:pyruvate formate lyase activating enzyme
MCAREVELHRADFWNPADNDELDCFLCNHRCHIKPGKRGVCRVRENREGVLYSLSYGRLISQNADPIEKKPLYHFLPGTLSYSIATPGCNFQCGFCQNWQISQEYGDLADYAAFTEPEAVVRGAVRSGCASIAYTYTEPTIYMEYALDTARLAKKEGLKNAFVTNGFESPEAIKAMTGLIDAANVDLKSFSDDFYRRSCYGRLEPVLNSIKAMHAAGIHVEVTTLVVTGLNDSEDELKEIAAFIAGVSRDMPWHISRFHPDYKTLDSAPTPLAVIERAVSLGEEAGLRYIYVGNVRNSDRQHTRCPECGALVISRSYMRVIDDNLDDGKCGACGAELPIIHA